jgi:hypothetical protein
MDSGTGTTLAPPDNAPGTSPWIDDEELEQLALRYPRVPRRHIAMAFEVHWPIKIDVQAAVARLAVKYADSLDFSAPSEQEFHD